MLITFLLLAGVFSLTVFLARRTNSDSSRLMEARSEIVMTGVQIICGDCAGEGRIPVKTFLDKNGNCSQCGGHSYLLAANCALRMQQLTPLRMSQLQKPGKVAFFAANPLVVQKHYSAKSVARR
jgi:hypothetical protein